ncbi:nitroreductase [Puteibacter caeruleilacunae]|nr:nitroreductase [Puteibacter caeruleilacunae]
MNFIDLAKRRYSVRSYSDKPVSKDLIQQVLEAGRIAPSAVNFQPWEFVIISEPENAKAFQEVYHRDWFNQAPVYIVICGDHNQAWHRQADGKDHTDVDASIAIDHMTLAATDAGLGTCWVCNFDVEKCREYLKLPDHIEPIAILPLGYPAKDDIPEKKRKSLDDICHWEKY